MKPAGWSSSPDASMPPGAGGAVVKRDARRRLTLGWQPPQILDRAGWLAAGVSLAEFGRVNNWWVGDWIRYGSARWGEKYTEAARVTGLDAKTLRNICYVASRFQLSRRRDNLSWTHHAELAALPPDQQDQWLDRAVSLRLSPGDLRIEVRAAQRALQATDENETFSLGVATREAAVDETFVCPHCEGVISLADVGRGAWAA